MIKIRLIDNGNQRYWLDIRNVLEHQSTLKFVASDEDLIFYTYCGAIPYHEEYKKFTTFNRPVVVFIYYDSTNIIYNDYVYLDNVIGVFKVRNLRDISMNNLKRLSNRYHYNIIKDTFQLSIKYIIDNFSKESHHKLHYDIPILPSHEGVVQTSPWQPYNIIGNKQEYLKYQPKNATSRAVDVLCVYNMRKMLDGFLRMTAMNQINEIKKHSTLNIVNEHVAPKDYRQTLRSSKIYVSCWGYGEWTITDFKCFLSEVIVIKPNSDFIHTNPDVYHSDKYYIACQVDYSDLEDKINYCLLNYDKLEPMRQNARQTVLRYFQTDNMSKMFVSQVQNAYQNYLDNDIPSLSLPIVNIWDSLDHIFVTSHNVYNLHVHISNLYHRPDQYLRGVPLSGDRSYETYSEKKHSFLKKLMTKPEFLTVFSDVRKMLDKIKESKQDWWYKHLYRHFWLLNPNKTYYSSFCLNFEDLNDAYQTKIIQKWWSYLESKRITVLKFKDSNSGESIIKSDFNVRYIFIEEALNASERIDDYLEKCNSKEVDVMLCYDNPYLGNLLAYHVENIKVIVF